MTYKVRRPDLQDLLRRLHAAGRSTATPQITCDDLLQLIEYVQQLENIIDPLNAVDESVETH